MRNNPLRPIVIGMIAGIAIWALLGCAIAVFGG